MKEIIVFTVLTGLAFLIFIFAMTFGLIQKNRKLKLTSLLFFLAFISLAGWTAFRFSIKSYNKVADTFKPRTGDEVYDALFDKRQSNCVKIIRYQDQVVPKIDYAIWLHFETCPEELKRILSKHEFTSDKLQTKGWNGKIPYGETLDWFNPTTLGDTIIVHEYSTNNSKSIQTIWASLDSTQVFCRDILY